MGPNVFNNVVRYSNVPHWFAETYVKEFALREYHLVLEVITLMVRNIVEGARLLIMDCFVHAAVCRRLTPTSRDYKEILRNRKANSTEMVV